MDLGGAVALVTGGTGFLGRHLVARLAGLGHAVRFTGRNASVGRALESPRARFVAADLSRAEAAGALCADIDVVFHCAARSSPWGRYREFEAANVDATRHVVSACLSSGVRRLVHVSTPSIYFAPAHRFDIQEDDPLPPPFNAYAATKRRAEEIVDAAGARGLETVTLRPRAIFGPYDQTILPRLVRAARRGRFPLIEAGRATIDVTCVENVVDGLLLAMDAGPAAVGKAFNLTNGEPLTVVDLLSRFIRAAGLGVTLVPWSRARANAVATVLETLARLTGSRWEPPLTRYSVGVLAWSQTLNIDAARRLLGYAPRVTLDEGFEGLRAWWRGDDTSPRPAA